MQRQVAVLVLLLDTIEIHCQQRLDDGDSMLTSLFVRRVVQRYALAIAVGQFDLHWVASEIVLELLCLGCRRHVVIFTQP